MDPISIGLALLKFAPGLLAHFGASKDLTKVADVAADIAQTVTNTSSPSAAIEALNANPELAAAYQTAVLSQSTRFEELYYQDKADARARDVAIITSGTRNYRADIMFFLAVLMIGGLVLIVWKDSTINEYVKGIFTLVLGRFLGYLDNIYNYEFGTTRINKTKDETIKSLTQFSQEK